MQAVNCYSDAAVGSCQWTRDSRGVLVMVIKCREDLDVDLYKQASLPPNPFPPLSLKMGFKGVWCVVLLID